MATEEVKTEEATPAAEGAGEAAPAAKPKFSLKSKKVKILGMLVGMMLIYAVVGHFFLPAPAHESMADEHSDDEEENKSEHGGASKVEVELGDGSFATTNEQAVTGVSIQVRFKLYVTVAESQHEEFKNLANVVNKNRVNEAIIEIFRAASHDDLRDPELNVMKQKIREKINRLLGTTAIIDVIFSGFSKLEQ